MKTREELDALKKEVEDMKKKLEELTEEEFTQVAGGVELENANFKGKFKYVMYGNWD